MCDAREQREVSLRDAERLVRAIGFAPGGDFFAVHTDHAGNAAARMHRPAQAVERRRVIVVNAPVRGVSFRIARPRNLVRLRKGDCFAQLLHDIHDSQRNRRTTTALEPRRHSKLEGVPGLQQDAVAPVLTLRVLEIQNNPDRGLEDVLHAPPMAGKRLALSEQFFASP